MWMPTLAERGDWVNQPEVLRPTQVTVHPSRGHVYHFVMEDEDDLMPWHWNVWHYEDTGGGRSHVTTRWGSCTRFEDALDSALAAVHREMTAFWGGVVADVDATGWVRRIPQ